MKIFKNNIIWCSALALAGLISCTGRQSEKTDSAVEEVNNDSVQVTVQDSVVTDSEPAEEISVKENDSEAEDIAMLTKFYKKIALPRDGDPAILKKYCTPACMKKLAAAYDYDDEGYALWDMTTSYQDGDGPTKLTNIEAIGDGWYKVSFLDMGHKGTTDVQVVNGKINDYRNQ